MHRPARRPLPTRRYRAPRRTASAETTREAILRAAKKEFEARGWAATTMRSIAMNAGVSLKTVEAQFATKPALLEATLLAALGRDAANTETGDLAVVRPEALLELHREAARQIEAAPDAASMLELHSALACEVHVRAARISCALETAVSTDERLAAIGARMTELQRFGARWSAEVLLRKPGIRADLTLREAEETFLTATDWNTYQTLTTRADMGPADVQAWVMRYYRHMLLA